MMNTIIRTINDYPPIQDLVVTVLINQIFEPYTQNEQIGQPRTNPTPYNHSFQQQNPVNTHSYQPTQMQNEIPLPYYLQQHEITKAN